MRGRWPRNNPLTDGQSINIAKHSHLPVMPRLPPRSFTLRPTQPPDPRSMPDRHAEQPARQPRTKPAEVRLEELMAAAQQLFLDKGVDATTISDIVAAAGVAKGTFYHYLPRPTSSWPCASASPRLSSSASRMPSRPVRRTTIPAACAPGPRAAWRATWRATGCTMWSTASTITTSAATRSATACWSNWRSYWRTARRPAPGRCATHG